MFAVKSNEMKNSHRVTIIAANSILLAVGISLVCVSIFAYGNMWPILTIFVHMLAIFFPTLCGQCSHDDMFGDENATNPLTHLPWVLFGLLVIVGYAVPVELFRANELNETAVYLTVAGGTTILCAVLIFVKVIYFQKSDNE